MTIPRILYLWIAAAAVLVANTQGFRVVVVSRSKAILTHHDHATIMWNQSPFEDNGGLEEVEPEEIPKDLEQEIAEGAPSEWRVMKELLGINIFTYILAGLIVIVFSLNTFLGPGWLGQQMGKPGTGTFTEYGESVPQVVDLSGDDNLLF